LLGRRERHQLGAVTAAGEVVFDARPFCVHQPAIQEGDDGSLVQTTIRHDGGRYDDPRWTG